MSDRYNCPWESNGKDQLGDIRIELARLQSVSSKENASVLNAFEAVSRAVNAMNRTASDTNDVLRTLKAHLEFQSEWNKQLVEQSELHVNLIAGKKQIPLLTHYATVGIIAFIAFATPFAILIGVLSYYHYDISATVKGLDLNHQQKASS